MLLSQLFFSVKGLPTAPHITRRTFPHLALQVTFGYLLQTFAVKYCCHSSSRYSKTYRTSWSTSGGNSSALGRWSISSTLKRSVWNWNSNLSPEDGCHCLHRPCHFLREFVQALFSTFITFAPILVRKQTLEVSSAPHIVLHFWVWLPFGFTGPVRITDTYLPAPAISAPCGIPLHCPTVLHPPWP